MTPKEALLVIGNMTTKRNLQDFPIGNQPKQIVKMKIKEMPEFRILDKSIKLLELYIVATNPNINWDNNDELSNAIETLLEELK